MPHLVEFEKWPVGQAPTEAHVYAHNELFIAAAPEVVWAWLVRALRWPSWYPNSWRVRIVDGPEHLTDGAVFTWITFGLPLTSTVDLAEESRAIGWRWQSRGWRGAAFGYHVWLLQPEPPGCRVITEETQRGVLPRLFSPVLAPALRFWHGVWLRRLSRNAVRGLPS
jgi:Polyketide cyclase / dehydrase and lipid transport